MDLYYFQYRLSVCLCVDEIQINYDDDVGGWKMRGVLEEMGSLYSSFFSGK